MKPTKNRTKFLRVNCGMCKAPQDSLHAICTNCGNPLYTNMSNEELLDIRAIVDKTEEQLNKIDAGLEDRRNPYEAYDRLRQLVPQLKKHLYIPGMQAYLDAVKVVQLPHQYRVLERTLKANIVFLLLLMAFAAIPQLLGWPPMISLLMLLPAMVWTAMTVKTYLSLKKVKTQLSQ